MSSVLSRWKSKLKTRRALLDHARRSVVYWGKRAGNPHGLAMLREARARVVLRQQQVMKAERVVARNSLVSNVSDAGVAFIAGFEGFRSYPYRDPVGVWTIGFGETAGIGPHTPPWTRARALRQLCDRVNDDFLAPVLRLANDVGLVLSQHEADALASLIYNLGPGILAHDRTMGTALRSKNRASIANAFLVYDRAGGNVLPGLSRRRRAERAMFLRH